MAMLRGTWSADGTALLARMGDGTSYWCPVQVPGNARLVVDWCPIARDVAAFLDAGGVVLPAGTVEPETLDQRIAAVESVRDKALAGSCVWNGNSWPMDTTFQLHLTGLVTAHVAGIVPDFVQHPIRTFDNQTIMLGIADIKSLSAAVLQAVQQVWQTSFTQKDAIRPTVA